MKISKRDLRRLILENILKEAVEAVDPEAPATEAGDAETVPPAETLTAIGKSYWEKINDMSSSAISAAEDLIDMDINGDRAVGSDPPPPPPPAVEKTSSKKITKNDKTAYIQKVIKAPSSDGGTKLGDGQWGGGTNTAWEEWVQAPENKKVFAELVKQKEDSAAGPTSESHELYEFFSRILKEEASEGSDIALPADLLALIADGAAAPIAKYFELSGNLSGVTELVKKMEQSEKTTEDKAQENDGEPADGGDNTSDESEDYMLSSLKLNKDRFQHDDEGKLVDKKQEKKAVILSTKANMDTQEALAQKPAIKKIFDFDDEGGLSLDLAKLDRKTKKDKMFFSKNKIIIRRTLAADIVITDVKIEGDYIVATAEEAAPVEESLSHGALIRKRYRRY